MLRADCEDPQGFVLHKLKQYARLYGSTVQSFAVERTASIQLNKQNLWLISEIQELVKAIFLSIRLYSAPDCFFVL